MVFGLNKKKQIKVEIDGNIRTAGLVEGSGIYRCNIHDFETEDINEFVRHNQSPDGHTAGDSGNGACGFCGKNVVYTNKQPEDKLLCDDCAEHLKKQLLKSNSGGSD